MLQLLLVEIKNVYGNEVIYPICDNAKNFVKLLNQKSFTQRDIDLIKQLGYTFTICNRNQSVKL